MPKLPFKDSEYYDQNDDEEDGLTPEDMEDVINFVGGDTDEKPFSDRPIAAAPGGTGRNNSTEKSVRGAMANKTNYPNGNPVKLTKSQLRDLAVKEAKKLFEVDDLVEPEEEGEDEIEEVSTTAGIAGFQAPLGSEIWGGARPAVKPEGWKDVDDDDVKEPSMKKSFKSSLTYNTRGKQKKESNEMGKDKKVIRLTEEQLAQIIKEGFFSQLFTKAAGKMAQAKEIGTNIGQMVKQVKTGETAKTKDPRVIKQITMASKTVTNLKEKFTKVLMNYTDDIVSIFGADPENMPEEAKTALNTVDESSTKFVEALDELIQIIDKFK